MDDDPEKLFDNFREIVKSCRKATTIWKDLVAGVEDHNVANFDLAYEAFKMEITRKLNYQDQLEYIRTLRKPGPMSVDDFQRELIILNDLAKQFPDAPINAVAIDDNEMVRLFYHAMPEAWQTAYMNAGYRHYSSTLHEVYDYMEALEETDPYKPNDKNSGQKSNGRNGSGNGSGNNGNSTGSNNNNNQNSRNSRRRNNNNNNRRGNCNNNGSNNNTNAGNNNNANRRIQPGDTCLLPGHQNHPWYKCRSNAHGIYGDKSKLPPGVDAESNTNEQNLIESPDVPYCTPCNEEPQGFSYLFDNDDTAEVFMSETANAAEEDTDSDSDDEEVPPLKKRTINEDSDSDSDDEDDYDSTGSVQIHYGRHPNVYNGKMSREASRWNRLLNVASKCRAELFMADSKAESKTESEPESKPAAKKAKPTVEPKKEPDVKTVRSGPLALSDGAYEAFVFDSLFVNEGVDRVLYPEMEVLVPTTIAAARLVNGKALRNTGLKTLIDHGASHSMINKRCLPKGVEVTKSKAISFFTTAGTFNATAHVFLEDFRLPEFNRNRSVAKVKCSVLENTKIKYDLILGRDFLNSAGVDVKSSSLTCEWCGDAIPFKPPSYITNDAAHDALQHSQTEPQSIVDQEHENHAVTFTATKSTFADIEDVADAQKHLSQAQQQQLLEILGKHTKLFSGKLGCFPHRKFHIDLKPGAKPYHCKKPYLVPNALRPIVKGELERQVKLGIMERVHESLWGMPMLCIPKKDGAIRTVDDLRKLNEQILRRVYPLPRITDMLRHHYKWKYVTVVDLTLCYYGYELDEESSWLCVLVTPFGRFRRKRLSMGLAQSPDWAQAVLEETLQEELHDFIECYIDNVAIFSNTWEEHLQHVATVLAKLEANGYTVNPAKCHWGVAEVEWMGHLITQDGLKLWPKKVEGIVNIAQPQTLKQLRAFIGMVNFY